METMKTKRQFIPMLKGIQEVTILRCPDNAGGHYFEARINETIEMENLPNFTYVEWSGDANEVLRKRNLEFVGHREPFHEDSYDTYVCLQELVEASIENRPPHLWWYAE